MYGPDDGVEAETDEDGGQDAGSEAEGERLGDAGGGGHVGCGVSKLGELCLMVSG